MELELFLNYVGNSLKMINSDVEKIRSNLYNNNDVLDHISSEVIMLENHIQYFSQINQAAVEEGEPELPSEEPEQPEPEEPLIPEPEPETRVFTLEELAQYNGQNGAPAYVAVNGVVYNVTDNPLWAGGNHFFGLSAGRDLSNEFAMCHPGAMVLSVLPVVGTLAAETE